MNSLFELLEKIRQQPGLYIGTSSITALRHFLVGYKFAQQEMGLLPAEEELDFYQEFQPWLQRRLHVRTVNSWDKIILIKCVEEKAAFIQFFQLLEEFRHRDKEQDIDPMLIDESSETPEQVA